MTKGARSNSQTAKQAAPPSRSSDLVQRKCDCGGAAALSGGCEKCRGKRLIGIQARLEVSSSVDHLEHQADRMADEVMRRSTAGSNHETSDRQQQGVTSVYLARSESAGVLPAVRELIDSPGQPLDANMRASMESRFGHDFSRVRVHADSRADASARAVGALAYTYGPHIAFAANRYAPSTYEGQRLLAHELVHTLQQGGAVGSGRGLPGLARKKAPWPAWHQNVLNDIAKFAGPSDGKTADAQWPTMKSYLCKLSKERAESLHARLSPDAPGLQGGTDDFAVYVKNKFPANHTALIAIMKEIAQEKLPEDCKTKKRKKKRKKRKKKKAPAPVMVAPPQVEPQAPQYTHDPTDPDPNYMYTGEPPAIEPIQPIRITAASKEEMDNDWLNTIELNHPYVVEMTNIDTMVDNVLAAAGDRPLEELLILDHGNETGGGVKIGSEFISASELKGYDTLKYGARLGRLRGHFSGGAKVTFLNCWAGKDEELMKELSKIFGVPVVATTGSYYYMIATSTGEWVRCQPSGECAAE